MMKPKQDAMRVTFSFFREQEAALEEYRHGARSNSRSQALRDVMRAGFAALAKEADTTREREAAARALEVWHEPQPEPHQATTPTRDPKP